METSGVSRMRKDDKDGVKKYRVSYISGAAQRAALVFLLLCMGFFAAVTVLEKMELDWAACVISHVHQHISIQVFNIADRNNHV